MVKLLIPVKRARDLAAPLDVVVAVVAARWRRVAHGICALIALMVRVQDVAGVEARKAVFLRRLGNRLRFRCAVEGPLGSAGRGRRLKALGLCWVADVVADAAALIDSHRALGADLAGSDPVLAIAENEGRGEIENAENKGQDTRTDDDAPKGKAHLLLAVILSIEVPQGADAQHKHG